MSISQKLATLAITFDPHAKPIVVKRTHYLLRYIPINKFECNLWVVDDGDWWRVMYSTKRPPFFGADFRKDDSVAGDTPITWKYEEKWALAQPSEATVISERITSSVERAYEQRPADQ